MSPIILIMIALSAGLFTYLMGVLLVSSHRRRAVMQHDSTAYERDQLGGILGQLKPLLQDLIRALGRDANMARIIKTQKIKYDPILSRCGNPGGLNGEHIFAFKLLLPPFLFLIVLMSLGAQYIFIAIAVGGLGFFLPEMKLRELEQKRTSEIKSALPDALDSFALMMSAGLDLNQSIDYYIDDPERGALQEEFYVMRAQMRLGKNRSQAITAMAERLRLDEFDGIATTVIQAEKSGVSMTEFFAGQADDVRSRRFQYAEEMGQKAPFKMMVPLMLFIMPCIFLVLFGPMAIRYFTGQFS